MIFLRMILHPRILRGMRVSIIWMLLSGLSGIVFALEPFVIKDIHVEGLQRISIGTVFNYLPVKVNDRMTDQNIKDSMRALFRTGFFKDVRFSRKGNTLVIKLVERPSIVSINITGSKKIPEDDLKKTLKESGLGEGMTFKRPLLDQMQLDLQQQYFSLGYYAVKIDFEIKPRKTNQVAIDINISEGRIALIEDIRIVGNTSFKEKELLGHFQLRKRADARMPFSKKDRYSKQKLQGDLETLRNYYMDAGYIDFSLDSTQVSVTPDREYVYITINITEGKKYLISSYKITGDTIIPKKEVEKLISIKSGKTYSRKEIVDISNTITERLGEEGYAFARVNAIPKTDRKKARVDFNFFINPGKRAYIRRINITGNTITRDEVIRRELRQLEGTWFSSAKIKRSRDRIQRLGFFEGVDIQTVMVPGAPDQLDLTINVKERSTGNIMMGAGYSDANGPFISLSYNERNAFGTGNEVVVSFDNSQATTVADLRYNNPYYTQSGISRGFQLYSRSVDAGVTGTGAYGTTTVGLGVNYGFPISDSRKLYAGLAPEGVTLVTTTSSAQVAQDFVSNYGPNVNILKTTMGWSQDTLNNFLFPTQGGLYRVQAEGGIPGGDLQYYQVSIKGSYFFPLTDERSTIRIRGEVAYGDGYGTNEELPFFKNYHAGGGQNLRGFRARGLGPIDPITGDPIGGNKLVTTNAEYFFPVPGSPKQGSSMRLSLFIDGGMVYGANQAFELGDIRYSVGFAFNWFTPVFPISLSYGIPLNSRTGDIIENFQFSIGLPIH